MKLKKSLIKVIQIGTLFVVSGISFLGVFSFSHPEINSFWNVGKLHFEVNQSFAESGEQESGENESSETIVETPVSTPLPSTNPVVDTPTSGSNGAVCSVVSETIYDTVTSASGTKSKVPRVVTKNVCSEGTTNPSQNTTPSPVLDTNQDKKAVDTLTPTSSGVTVPLKQEDIAVKLILGGLTDKQKSMVLEKLETKFSKLTPQNQLKKYTQLQNIVQKLISNLSEKILLTSDDIKIAQYESKIAIYSDIETILSEKIEKNTSQTTQVTTEKTYLFKAPNGKIYTIIVLGDVVTIKKADGSYAKESFTTYEDAVAYLNKNAVIAKKVTAPVVTKPKTVTSALTTKKITQPSTTQVQTQPKKTTPVVVKPSPAPKVDTTTSAS